MIFMLPFPFCTEALCKKAMTLFTHLVKTSLHCFNRISHLIFHVILKDTIGILPRICFLHSDSVTFTLNLSSLPQAIVSNRRIWSSLNLNIKPKLNPDPKLTIFAWVPSELFVIIITI